MDPRTYPQGADSAGTDWVKYLKKITVSFNPASVNAATCAEQDVTVPGVAVGDIVLAVEADAAFSVAIGIAGWRTKAANLVAVRFINPSAGALDASAVNLTFLVARIGVAA